MTTCLTANIFINRSPCRMNGFRLIRNWGEIKYQIGEGCHVDQVIGQWYAHVRWTWVTFWILRRRAPLWNLCTGTFSPGGRLRQRLPDLRCQR